jgi:hypothetical protein
MLSPPIITLHKIEIYAIKSSSTSFVHESPKELHYKIIGRLIRAKHLLRHISKIIHNVSLNAVLQVRMHSGGFCIHAQQRVLNISVVQR